LQADLIAHALYQSGYEVTHAHDGRQAYELVRSGQFRILVSDWEMPQMTGPELCRAIRQHPTSGYVYVIPLTLRSGPENAIEGLRAGADDFVSKPFHPQELCVRLRTAERILSLESREMTIFALAKLTESRDSETGAHLERIREYCRILAEDLATRDEFRNEVDGQFTHLIYMTSPLHDIGKVGTPDAVLLKNGRLTEEEFAIMQQHTVIGGQTLDSLVEAYPDAVFLRMARDIAWTHHERFDGTGYPRGLAGTEIPLCGRIVAVADVYDALTTRRIYKDAFSHEVARSIIVQGRGQHFDPQLVDAFLRNEARFVQVKEQYSAQEANQLTACS
jgi:putative two-component system response regulator